MCPLAELSGLVPNTNPVIFDPVGEADILWATDALYNLVLRDAFGEHEYVDGTDAMTPNNTLFIGLT